MSPDERVEFLQGQRTLVLSTIKKSGSPVMHALWFTYLDDAIYINIQSTSFKYRNLVRDDRVCCLIEAGEDYFDLRGVMIEGRATIVTDPAEIARVQAAADEKSERIGSGTDALPAYFSESRKRRLDRGDRVLVKIPMQHVRTWNFGKARPHYEQANVAPETG